MNEWISQWCGYFFYPSHPHSLLCHLLPHPAISPQQTQTYNHWLSAPRGQPLVCLLLPSPPQPCSHCRTWRCAMTQWWAPPQLASCHCCLGCCRPSYPAVPLGTHHHLHHGEPHAPVGQGCPTCSLLHTCNPWASLVRPAGLYIFQH